MRRSDMLKITGWTSTAFNNVAARGHLPFTARTREATWGDYSADDACRLAIMAALSEAGWSQQAAAKSVRAGFNRLKAAAKQAEDSAATWLFGSVWMAVNVNRAAVKKRRTLVAQVGKVDEAVAQRLATDGGRLERYAVVSVSRVVAQLKARADEEGVASARLDVLNELLGGQND